MILAHGTDPTTIREFIKQQAERLGDNPAVIGFERGPLSYSELLGHLSNMMGALNAGGIGRGDRVAVVLPNGPEMALAFLGIAACAACAPLNAAYRKDEYEFYFKDLGAKALLTAKRDPTSAREVARSLGLTIIDVEPSGDAAGLFSITVQGNGTERSRGFAEAEDVALLLHTSGTTSRPKMVPLTQSNLCTSAANVAAALHLHEKDRCLNVMPLFHIHGIVASLLATLHSGGTVICTTGFSEAYFFEWMDTYSPTWYTAVPTMHQAILHRSEGYRKVIERNPLRFIRSSSSALPPKVMRALESCFNSPVIEAYGMTEAAHQMTSNPLTPAIRKPRSVGVPAGPEVAILSEDGVFLDPGQMGEIVIRGANITPGYDNNPQANADAFMDGWFRTGDLGEFDADGYLFITGRKKEMINRGGEKVSPREVDEVLMDHPDVAQALAFAVPHPTLGEDLAVAVVPKDGRNPDETQLREFAAGRLSNFKVPTRIILVDAIPKGPTGKPQRIGLADRLFRELEVSFETPVSETERLIASIFEDVLRHGPVGRKDNFFALGGDSIVAMRAHNRLSETFGISVSATLLFRRPTISELAGEVERLMEEQEVEFLAREMENLPREEAFRLLDDDDIHG